MAKRVVRFSVAPGKASPSNLAPLLQPHGVDVGKVVEEVNKRTRILANYGIGSVFVEVEIEASTGSFEVKPDLPPVTELIIRAVGKESGSHQAAKEIIGDLSMEKVAEIAYLKWSELRSRDFRGALKQVVSACRAVGVTVDGKDPKQVIAEISRGDYGDLVAKYEELLRSEGML